MLKKPSPQPAKAQRLHYLKRGARPRLVLTLLYALTKLTYPLTLFALYYPLLRLALKHDRKPPFGP